MEFHRNVRCHFPCSQNSYPISLGQQILTIDTHNTVIMQNDYAYIILVNKVLPSFVCFSSVQVKVLQVII